MTQVEKFAKNHFTVTNQIGKNKISKIKIK